MMDIFFFDLLVAWLNEVNFFGRYRKAYCPIHCAIFVFENDVKLIWMWKLITIYDSVSPLNVCQII